MFDVFRDLDFRPVDLVDIGLVAFFIYWILHLIRGTRAVYMLVGLVVAVIMYWLSSFGELYTVNWILSNFFGSLFLVIVVIFQDDLRRMLTRIGHTQWIYSLGPSQENQVIEELVKTSVSLANKKIGALIVLERDANVTEYVDVGITLDAVVSKELITSIFLPTSPLHDGAIVLQKGRLTAAGCFLPLTMNPSVGVEVGTRHRAAIGLTEETDSVAIVVSEEKGWISLVVDGRITKGLDGAALRKMLIKYVQPQVTPLRRLWAQWTRPKPEQT